MSHHIVSRKTYAKTFGGLLTLTFLTVFVTRFDFGSLNIIFAMLIAFAKASLVIFIFMGLKWDKGFNRLMFLGSLLFFLIFIGLTLSDTQTRSDIDPIEGQTHSLHSPVKLILKEHIGHH